MPVRRRRDCARAEVFPALAPNPVPPNVAAEHGVRLVLTPVVMHQSLLAYDVQITMRYELVSATTGRTVEHHEISTIGHSAKLEGIERSAFQVPSPGRALGTCASVPKRG